MRRAGRVLVSVERTLQDCSARSYATSPLFDFRRLRDRSRWISPVDETDADFKTVPLNHIGNNDDVNWAFNEYQVTPAGKTNVYRNLHLRGLQMLANGKKGKNNTLLRQSNELTDHQIYYVAPNDASPNAVPPSTWTNVSRLVKETLSGENQESLFMKDGFLGSLQVSNLPVRVLTNSGFVSLFLNHAIFPTNSSVDEFYHSATLWVVDSSATPFPYAKAGINSKNFTLLDKQKNRAIIVGDSLTTTALENSLVALARDFYSEKLSLLLPCDTVIDKNGKTSFIFSGDKSINPKSFDVYSSKSSLWNYFGVSRVFNSYQSNSVSPTASRGDIIEQFGNVTKFTSSENKPFPSVVSHPNSVIFFTDNPSAPGISPVNDSAQCKNLFQSSNSDLASIADQFISNIEEDKIKCFLVNSTGNQIDSLIAKTISEA